VVTLLLVLALLNAHPIHTTVLHFRWDARSAVLEGTLRIFDDDLRGAAKDAGLSPKAYVLKHVGVVAAGRPVPLTPCGEQRVADAVLVCLRGRADDLRGLRVRNELLLERYADQVNIVRVERGSAATILLTRATPQRSIE
jgi:hypothetical protein